MGRNIITIFSNNLDSMTLIEVLTLLRLLKKMSCGDEGKFELEPLLPSMLVIFKKLLKYNNNEINNLIIDILDNFVLRCDLNKIKNESTSHFKTTSSPVSKIFTDFFKELHCLSDENLVNIKFLLSNHTS